MKITQKNVSLNFEFIVNQPQFVIEIHDLIGKANSKMAIYLKSGSTEPEIPFTFISPIKFNVPIFTV